MKLIIFFKITIRIFFKYSSIINTILVIFICNSSSYFIIHSCCYISITVTSNKINCTNKSRIYNNRSRIFIEIIISDNIFNSSIGFNSNNIAFVHLLHKQIKMLSKFIFSSIMNYFVDSRINIIIFNNTLFNSFIYINCRKS